MGITAHRVTVVKVDSAQPAVPFWRDSDDHSACITLDAEGRLYGEEYHLGSNAWTFDQWHRRELFWSLNPALTRDQVNELLEDIAGLAQVVVDGHSIQWDGNNHVGVLTGQAEEAVSEIGRLVEAANEDPAGLVFMSMDDFGDWGCSSVVEDSAGLEGSVLRDWVQGVLEAAAADAVAGQPGGAFVVSDAAVEEMVAWIVEARDDREGVE